MTSRVGNKGFTLLELLVVLLIVGLVSSVAVFSMIGQSEKSLIKSEARKLYASLKHAREQAISRHSMVTFEIEEENTGYSITSSNKRIYYRSLPETISVYAEKVVFYPIGDSTGGVIVLIDEHERKYEITVSHITGKAKIERIQSL